MDTHHRKPHISVVVPVYGAEACLVELHRRLVAAIEAITPDFEMILIEDCGGDRSWEVIEDLARKDPRVRGFQFSRNFGQHYGIAAGLDKSRGDWVVIMDCDLQDQPEEIRRLYDEARKGHDVVLARRMRRQDPLHRRLKSAAFYTVFNYLTGVRFEKEVAGFCILSRDVVRALCAMREQDRFLMAFVQWVGFPTSRVEVDHAPRYAGETSYSLRRLLRHAWNTSIAFSIKPLHYAIRVGFAMSALSLIAALYVFYLAFTGRTQVAGWASIAVSLYFLSGLIIANLGIVGIYLGKVYGQTKARPLYVIRRATEGTPSEPGPATPAPHGGTRGHGAGRPGHVFWITGLSGSGKTTVSKEVHRLLADRIGGTGAVIRLDGDGFREIMGKDLGHDMEDRLKNAWRIARMCRFLAEQGVHVVCATQSLFRACHEWNREHIANYHEVYLKVSRQTLVARDQRGLYSGTLSGDGGQVVGLDQPWDEPAAPDLVIRNEAGGDDPATAADRIVALLGEA